MKNRRIIGASCLIQPINIFLFQIFYARLTKDSVIKITTNYMNNAEATLPPFGR